MKYFKRLNMWKAANVSYSPDTELALSYDWWAFVARINGKLVFNSYRYSVTTAKHQSKCLAVLRQLGVEPDIMLDCPAGLTAASAGKSARMYYQDKLQQLQEKLTNKRIRETTRMALFHQITETEKKLAVIRQIFGNID